MNTTQKTRLGSLEDHLSCGDIIYNYAEDYADPGYSREGNGPIALGNWNDKTHYDPETQERTVIDDTPSRLAAVLERAGWTIDWDDEYLVCECGKAFRVQADSYSWTMYGFIGDGDYACGDCVQEDPEAFIQSYLNEDRMADTIGLDLESIGFVQVPEDTFYESGFHPGQNDNPSELGPRLTPDGYDRIWQINGTGQFDVRFSLWIRPEGYEGGK
jgi:hypothetical protein